MSHKSFILIFSEFSFLNGGQLLSFDFFIDSLDFCACHWLFFVFNFISNPFFGVFNSY